MTGAGYQECPRHHSYELQNVWLAGKKGARPGPGQGTVGKLGGSLWRLEGRPARQAGSTGGQDGTLPLGLATGRRM